MPSLLGNPTMSTKTSLFRQKRLPIIKIKASTTSSTATIDLYPQIEMETQTQLDIKPVMYDASIDSSDTVSIKADPQISQGLNFSFKRIDTPKP